MTTTERHELDAALADPDGWTPLYRHCDNCGVATLEPGACIHCAWYIEQEHNELWKDECAEAGPADV